MSNDSSLGGAEVSSGFDFETQKGVTLLLSSIRASDLNKVQKSELRDLVFEYTSGGRDHSTKLTLEQKIKSFSLAPMEIKQPEVVIKEKYVPTFGTSRPAPSFSPSVTSKKSVTRKPLVEEEIKAEPKKSIAPSPEVNVNKDVSVVKPVENAKQNLDHTKTVSSPVKPELDKVSNAAEQEKPKPDNNNNQEAELARKNSHSAPPKTDSETQFSSSDPETNMARIREIKSLVTEKIGNPVNLVDINNEVGREYMSSMLDAMKKVGSGSAALSAMQRLEKAYSTVEKTLEDKTESSQSTSQPNKPVQVDTPPASPPAPEIKPAPRAAELPRIKTESDLPEAPAKPSTRMPKKPVDISAPTAPKTTQTKLPQESIPENKPEAKVDSKPVFKPASVQAEEEKVEAKVVDNEPPKAPLPSPAQAIPAPPQPAEPIEQTKPITEILEPVPEEKTEPGSISLSTPVPAKRTSDNVPETKSDKIPEIPVPVKDSVEQSVPGPSPAQTASTAQVEPKVEKSIKNTVPVTKAEDAKPLPVATQTFKPASLADNAEGLKTPDDLPSPSSLESSSVDGDPLYTGEVDEGLDQLLSMWPIFKKSGLFGTGPKGSQHPLYLKISELQIPLLLAGRFEGATQEIKQSITDYMNGWRYEQGIIYTQGETFDHYLRRVIRHIIDLQNNN